jgi:hypothetical protein
MGCVVLLLCTRAEHAGSMPMYCVNSCLRQPAQAFPVLQHCTLLCPQVPTPAPPAKPALAAQTALLAMEAPPAPSGECLRRGGWALTEWVAWAPCTAACRCPPMSLTVVHAHVCALHSVAGTYSPGGPKASTICTPCAKEGLTTSGPGATSEAACTGEGQPSLCVMA